MLKVGTKRRRTKGEILAAEAEAKQNEAGRDYLYERIAKLEPDLHMAKTGI